jgi:ABC-type lipoprotein release transport system permease subunit
MHAFLEILRSGMDGIHVHRLRSAVTVVVVAAVLVPLLVGLAISEGVRREAEVSIGSGGDLYVSGESFGRPAPLPMETGSQLREVAGVTGVMPRIVGSIRLGAANEEAVVVGSPALPLNPGWVHGRLPEAGSLNELAVGQELARKLHLQPGAMLPPFYRSTSGERVSRVVGVIRPPAPFWSARLILTSLPTAAQMFDRPGLVTDFVVTCRPGEAAAVRQAVRTSLGSASHDPALRPRIISRDDLRALLSRSAGHREGVFHMHMLVAAASSVGLVLVSAGVGLTERKREIALLKATGWHTDEVLLRSFAESAVLSLMAASLSVSCALAWLAFLNGYGIAPLFISGLDAGSLIQIPFHLTGTMVLLAGAVAFAVVLSGTLYAAWRTAVTPPSRLLR